jgi:hypothetical protein
MKALAVFLSFYIVLLGCIACVDVARHDTTLQTELSQNTNKDHSSDADTCSPFCTCQCCQANCYVSNTPGLFSSEPLGIIYHENNPKFQSLDLFDFLIPPKS